ncbi:putative phosphonate C-P lyase system protein PhnK [Actinomyces johnsonii F0542]|uniref:Putative phosphonate C-P lyase system protein PhnK n=1 Tax=Actinomyces johnsonii F0542 TaxID=1321818 RepID=U1QMX2_9ACTO|nr:dipeptide ABC transporter ATP-binding protein [Actinomyces johnsonii]ERH23441.1 putative phosphonate C-P lyase system protein PhnK [Actinomyces johnsonii F0542]
MSPARRYLQQRTRRRAQRCGSPLTGLLASLTRSRRARTGVVVLALLIIAALLAPVISPGDPARITGAPAAAPSPAHWFGVTPKGQDVLAMTLWGARSSMAVGLGAGVLATLVALVVALASAHLGRTVDGLLSVATNVFLLLPGLPLLVVLAAYMPPGWGSTLIVLVVTGWAGAARVLRSQAMSLRGTDFVEAAVVSGERPVRIMADEMLPNMASVVMSTLLGCVNAAIGAQAGLEFLGLGRSDSVSWGTNLYWAATDGALMTGRWWTFVPSGLAIALVAYALALINAGVDEATNPGLRRAASGAPGRQRSPAPAAEPDSGNGAVPEPVLRIEDLSVEYDAGDRPGGGGRVIGVDRFSLAVGRDEVMGLAGPSGCGKTTVAAAIMRLLGPAARITSGRVLVGGRDVLTLEAGELRRLRWREIAIVPQAAMNALNPVMTIGEQIADVLTTHDGLRRRTACERAAELLESVGIPSGRLRAYPHQLSGGQRQRVVIAMALALRPHLLVLDEPTTALDVVVQREIMELVLDLKARLSFSVLLITHDLFLMAGVCDRIGVMEAGRLVEEGPARRILTSPAHPATQALVSGLPPRPGRRKKTSAEPILEVEGLRKDFPAGGLLSRRTIRALDGVDLTLHRGEILALVGRTGSGKSTLARVIARLEAPASGRLLLEGRDVLAEEPRRASRSYRRRVQMVFQDPFASLNPAHTVGHALGRALTVHRSAFDRADIAAEAAELLDAVGLEPELLGARPHELSGGQRQRVAIARALACEPEVLVADEPTSMLDAPLCAGILDLLLRLRRERDLSILYITHDLASARYLADTTAVLQAGRLVETGLTAELMEHPTHPCTRLLLSAIPAWSASRCHPDD